MNKIRFITFCFILFAVSLKAQQIPRFNPDTIMTITIDSAVANIRSHKLNAQDFIDAVMNDTSFYKAFQNMKGFAFTAENRIYTYDKKNRVEGKIYRRLLHSNQAGKHKIEYTAKRDSGNVFKKNGKYQLYTVEMFDYIFMNAYNSDFVKSEGTSAANKSKNEGYKAKLKTLVFTPGRKVSGIPFISSKTEIFGPELRQFYTYEFARGTYLDSIPVYRFKVKRKPSTAADDVMIQEMTTIFDVNNFQILGRYIDMKYSNMLFDFNVQMNIELNKFNDELLPVKISYQGNWDIPFHQEERASFLIVHKDYKKE
ncbi:hypothetical protein [Mucilaginibacter phyllosphaerae]|uniref:Uncharacterized protein n=1 Tax=Mucilaginibacter phyllosphaerae TaxID=1812349 RepID=A0A4Y8AF32_9SPHI|nr:hypothetical protein [Mucilaginibacter phyllosphaerae]MBB3968995.1 hypothetical protein [Mucilaginibacter phyllosphaerae]TEW67386.1 hypothetical protein E2R65_05190 [Mucilaginibacter phyllosphaerae]